MGSAKVYVKYSLTGVLLYSRGVSNIKINFGLNSFLNRIHLSNVITIQNLVFGACPIPSFRRTNSCKVTILAYGTNVTKSES